MDCSDINRITVEQYARKHGLKRRTFESDIELSLRILLRLFDEQARMLDQLLSGRGHQKPAVIRTPFPSVNKVANVVGVSPKRVREIQELVKPLLGQDGKELLAGEPGSKEEWASEPGDRARPMRQRPSHQKKNPKKV